MLRKSWNRDWPGVKRMKGPLRDPYGHWRVWGLFKGKPVLPFNRLFITNFRSCWLNNAITKRNRTQIHICHSGLNKGFVRAFPIRASYGQTLVWRWMGHWEKGLLLYWPRDRRNLSRLQCEGCGPAWWLIRSHSWLHCKKAEAQRDCSVGIENFPPGP